MDKSDENQFTTLSPIWVSADAHQDINVDNSFNENEARELHGLEYNPHFEHVLLSAAPGSCCSRDSIQATKRVRYTKTNHIY